MRVSIVVCTYSLACLPYLEKAVRSLIQQDYRDLQLIIVIDGNRRLYESVKRSIKEWNSDGPNRDILIIGHRPNKGLSYSRNRGIGKANGEIIAFFDDDAIADGKWISTLVDTYDRENALAVGGKILPIWVSDKPGFLPEECYWLVGATHKGFAQGNTEVRNTFGSNISFKRQVFTQIGGFEIRLGRKGRKLLQGEETELAMRMRKKMNRGVFYNPDALVHHHVFQNRVNVLTLLKRSLEQGRSKRILAKIARVEGYSMDSETEFAEFVMKKAIPEKIHNIGKIKSNGLYQFLFLTICVGLVTLGFITCRPGRI